MRHLSVRIDKRLRAVESWWKLQFFLKWTILIALGVALLLLALGMTILAGWIIQPAWANGWLTILLSLSFAGWLIIALISAGTPKDPAWLAASLEKSRSDLEDRLNTLIYLQNNRDPQSRELSRALEHQIDQVLRAAPTACPFSWKRILRHLAAFSVALLVTISFYTHFEPWSRLQAAVPPTSPEDEQLADLEIPDSPKPPEDQVVDEREKIAWGEIRITEPGRDLKVTRLDLIPLQIEAASNRTLNRVEWVTLINEGPTKRHGLPAPEHPNYVVYRPSLLIEDYGLEDWDVMSYFAEASTEEGEQYRSVEYFIEIVPPRPELEKLPEPAYESLEDITGLIEWQEEVIRETGRLSQLEGLDEEHLKTRQGELAAQEQQIQKAAEHLSAKLESRFGSEPIEGMRQQFQSAAFSLDDAQTTLEQSKLAESDQNERTALGRLVAARKHFHERVKQDPSAFEASPEELLAKKSPSQLDEQQLQELQTRLDERQQSLNASQDKLQQLIKRQQLVEIKTKRAREKLWKELSEQEQQLQEDLQQLTQQSPDTSQEFQSAAKTAGETLQRAQEALNREDKPASEQETAQATEQLKELANNLENEMDQLELAEQMLLEERLRRNREQYEQIEKQDQPRTPEELEQTTQETQQIVDELEKIAHQQEQQQPEESPEDSPSELQRQLTPEKREQLAGKCDKMCKQPGASGQSQSAGEIGQSLEKLADALQQDLARQLAGQGPPQLEQNLDQMQTAQNQQSQAREAVQKALAEQREIERGINPSRPQANPALSKRQKQATDGLEEAMQQNPDGFSPARSQAEGAKNAMRQSERSLQSSNPLSRQRANEAAEELRRLDSALEEQKQKSQLADAYRQKQMLEEQIEQLKRFEQNPESVKPSQCQSSGGACKNLTGSMQNLMQQPGMSGAFGPQLQEALNDENKQKLDQQSDNLADAKTPGEVESSAGQLRESLEKLAQAFDSGQPGQGPTRKPGSSLKPSGQQAISEGMRRLESESQRNRQGRAVPRQESQQLREDAMTHIAEGLFQEYGYNEQTRTVVMRWEEELKDPDFTVDQRVLQQLLRDIQQTRGEVALDENDPTQKPGVQTIDPSKYPPEYRPLIESYFQKLSERP